MPHNPVQQKISQFANDSLTSAAETTKKGVSQEFHKTFDSGLEQLTGTAATHPHESQPQESGDAMAARLSHETETEATIEMQRRKLEEIKKMHTHAQQLGTLPTLQEEREMKEHQEKQAEIQHKKGLGPTLLSKGKNLFSKMDLGKRAAQKRENRDAGRASG